MTPVRLEPAALRSRVKHSTTEPLRSHAFVALINLRSVLCLYDIFVSSCMRGSRGGGDKGSGPLKNHKKQYRSTSPKNHKATEPALNEPQREKTCLRGFANNTDADQPAHPRRLISAFVIRFLVSFICKLATGEISIF